jgi:lipopolysaccharide exporter
MTLFSGSSLAQIISIGALIVLQRFFYNPEEYAPFRLFFEYVAVFSSVSALRLESGLILEREDDKAISLLRVCIRLCFIVSIIGGLIFSLYFYKEIEVFQHEWVLLILMPFAIFGNGLIQIFQPFFTRAKSFLTISSSKIIHSIIGSTTQIITGLLGFNFVGLIIGRIAGLISADLNYFKKFYKTFKWNSKRKKEEKKLLKKHKKFIYFTSPGIFVGNSINLVILVVFTHYYGEKFTGLTAAAIQYLGLICMLFSSSFAQVYYNEIAQINDPKELFKSYTFWIKRLFILTLIGWTTLMLTPASIVTLVLGGEWNGLMDIIKLISPWMAIMFLASSLSYVFIRLGKQKEIFFFDLFHLILVLLALFGGHFFFENSKETLYIVTIVQSVFYVLSISLAYFFLNKAVKKEEI